MTTTKLKETQYLLVDVPVDAKMYGNRGEHYYHDEKGRTCYTSIGMHRFASWQIVGKGSDITEEVWRGIVELMNVDGFGQGYKDYKATQEGDFVLHGLAKRSGHSWITSLGHKPESVLVLRKV